MKRLEELIEESKKESIVRLNNITVDDVKNGYYKITSVIWDPEYRKTLSKDEIEKITGMKQ